MKNKILYQNGKEAQIQAGGNGNGVYYQEMEEQRR